MGSAEGRSDTLKGLIRSVAAEGGQGSHRERLTSSVAKEMNKADDRGWGRGDLFCLDGVGSFKGGI